MHKHTASMGGEITRYNWTKFFSHFRKITQMDHFGEIRDSVLVLIPHKAYPGIGIWGASRFLGGIPGSTEWRRDAKVH